jgi:hypothetical protein
VIDTVRTSPVRIPARQCLMSGQLPKTCNCEDWIDLAQDPGERVSAASDPAYVDPMRHFRARLAELCHGPSADPDYRDAGH